MDAKPLLPYAVNLLSIEHFNLLNQFVQHPGRQFPRSGVLADKTDSAYLNDNFTYIDTTYSGEKTFYNYQDDMGNHISLGYKYSDFGDFGTFEFLTIYFDKVIADYSLHEYQGTNPVAGNPIEYAAVGDSVFFGTYEQVFDEENAAEPIAWRVLDEDQDGVLLISDKVLFAKAFNEEIKATTWETSPCREWLNQSFFSEAFTEAEQAQIRETDVCAFANPKFGTDAGRDTKDRVFLLSYQEVKKYFPEAESRMTKATQYAAYTGVELYGAGYAGWITRSPGVGQEAVVACASDSGLFIGIGDLETSVGNGGLYVNVLDGIRPAIWVNVERYQGLTEKDFETAN